MSGLNYISWLRGMPCIVCHRPGEPHHLKAVGLGRNRKKDIAEHWTAVPLCRQHHDEYHTWGRQTWTEVYGDPYPTNKRLRLKYGQSTKKNHG